MMVRTDQQWPWSLIRKALETEAVAYSGVRRIIQNFHWTISSLPPITYEDLGYTKAKEKQLLRNYYDPEEFARAKAILDKRSKKSGLTSVALSLRGKKKDSRSMGWCMLNLVVSRVNKVETVDMYYRSTELIFKFGADLVFIRWMFDQLGLKPSKIRFHFTNAFISGGYWPCLLQFSANPIDFLATLRGIDQKFFYSGTRVLLRSSLKQDQKYLYSPHNQQHKLLWRVHKPKLIKEIAEFLKGAGVKAEVPRDTVEEDDE